jgi:hypothetical protein
MRRRLLILASIVLTVVVVGVGGILFAINRAIDARSGPVHHFPVPAGETVLTDARAATIGRDLMNRDGFPESAWKLMTDDRTKAPDGRPDQFLTRNTINSNQGYVYFYCENSPTPQRFVNIGFRDGQITAQGTLGK